jgi:hypothetical protein
VAAKAFFGRPDEQLLQLKFACSQTIQTPPRCYEAEAHHRRYAREGLTCDILPDSGRDCKQRIDNGAKCGGGKKTNKTRKNEENQKKNEMKTAGMFIHAREQSGDATNSASS